MRSQNDLWDRFYGRTPLFSLPLCPQCGTLTCPLAWADFLTKDLFRYIMACGEDLCRLCRLCRNSGEIVAQ